MGQAMRGNHLMNIDLCSVVWKALVYQPLDSSDLRAIDSAMYLQLEAVRNPPADLSPSDFDREMIQQQQLWSVVNAKGAVVALPGYEDRFAAQKVRSFLFLRDLFFLHLRFVFSPLLRLRRRCAGQSAARGRTRRSTSAFTKATRR